MSDLDALVSDYRSALAKQDQARIDAVTARVPEAQLEAFLSAVEPYVHVAPAPRSFVDSTRSFAALGADEATAFWLAAITSDEDLADVLGRADLDAVRDAVIADVPELAESGSAVRRYLRRIVERKHDARRLQPRITDALSHALALSNAAVLSLQERMTLAQPSPAAMIASGDLFELSAQAMVIERKLVDELFDGDVAE